MTSTITMTITNYEHEIRSPISDVRVTGTSLESLASSLEKKTAGTLQSVPAGG